MTRIELQDVLENLLGSNQVYFQPPISISMKYPAIRYSISNIGGKKADNGQYTEETTYNLILIDKNPDSQYLKKLLKLKYCKFDRSYVSDNLNHFSFTIII